MATWTLPKTNWTSADVVVDTDMNRIEGNTEILHQGNGVSSIATATIGATGNLTINGIDETFLITPDGGGSPLRTISTTDRLLTNRIQLIMAGASAEIYSNQSAGAGFATIKIMRDTTGSVYAGSYLYWKTDCIMTFIYTSNGWVSMVS